MKPTIFADGDELGEALAGRIADGIASAAMEGRRYLLGCPGGRSPRTTYRALADQVARRSMSLDHVVIVMMDDYVVADRETGSWKAVPSGVEHSCRRFAELEIVGPLFRGATDNAFRDDQLWFPDPSDPSEYDTRIAAAGGVDLFILATGSGDGHVAFNPPGSDRSSTTRVVELATQTRKDNLLTFPSFGSLRDVPNHGVTVGIATIRELSREAVLIAIGAEKASACARLIDADSYDPTWPATVIAECSNASLYVDVAAANGSIGNLTVSEESKWLP